MQMSRHRGHVSGSLLAGLENSGAYTGNPSWVSNTRFDPASELLADHAPWREVTQGDLIWVGPCDI